MGDDLYTTGKFSVAKFALAQNHLPFPQMKLCDFVLIHTEIDLKMKPFFQEAVKKRLGINRLHLDALGKNFTCPNFPMLL
jgi:hypothetical protein